MKNLSILTKSVLIALSLLGMGTLAIASGQIPAVSGAKVSDAVAIATSKISLEQAIAIAQKNMSGDLVSAEFDQNDYLSGGKFEVKSISNDTEHEIKIDASNGKILKTKLEKLDAEDLAEHEAMKQAKISLIQAMQQATQAVNGKVIEAKFDLEDGKPMYDIEIAKGTQIYDLMIDSMTGQVISNQLDQDD